MPSRYADLMPKPQPKPKPQPMPMPMPMPMPAEPIDSEPIQSMPSRADAQPGRCRAEPMPSQVDAEPIDVVMTWRHLQEAALQLELVFCLRVARLLVNQKSIRFLCSPKPRIIYTTILCYNMRATTVVNECHTRTHHRQRHFLIVSRVDCFHRYLGIARLGSALINRARRRQLTYPSFLTESVFKSFDVNGCGKPASNLFRAGAEKPDVSDVSEWSS